MQVRRQAAAGKISAAGGWHGGVIRRVDQQHLAGFAVHLRGRRQGGVSVRRAVGMWVEL